MKKLMEHSSHTLKPIYIRLIILLSAKHEFSVSTSDVKEVYI